MGRPRSCSPSKTEDFSLRLLPSLQGLLDYVRDIGLRHGMVRHWMTTGCWNNQISQGNQEVSSLSEPMQPTWAYTCSGFWKEDSASSSPPRPINQLLNPRCSSKRKNFGFLQQFSLWTHVSQHSVVCGQRNSPHRS